MKSQGANRPPQGLATINQDSRGVSIEKKPNNTMIN